MHDAVHARMQCLTPVPCRAGAIWQWHGRRLAAFSAFGGHLQHRSDVHGHKRAVSTSALLGWLPQQGETVTAVTSACNLPCTAAFYPGVYPWPSFLGIASLSPTPCIRASIPSCAQQSYVRWVRLVLDPTHW